MFNHMIHQKLPQFAVENVRKQKQVNVAGCGKIPFALFEHFSWLTRSVLFGRGSIKGAERSAASAQVEHSSELFSAPIIQLWL